MKRLISFAILSFICISCTIIISASSAPSYPISEEEIETYPKIEFELAKVMHNADDDEIITIYLWKTFENAKKDESYNLNEELLNFGFDAEMYENETRFREVIIPDIIQKVIEEYGYEKAYEPIDCSIEKTEEIKKAIEDGKEIELNYYCLINKTINEKMDDYISKKNELISERQSNNNNDFIEKYVNKDRDILYNGTMTGTLILEATKEEIIEYSKLDIVTDISLYEDLIAVPG